MGTIELPGAVMDTINPRTMEPAINWEAEAGRSLRVQGQLGLHKDTKSQRNKKQP